MDYVRYLRSKETVDDRAINLRVLQTFEGRIAKHVASRTNAPLRIVEVGGGVGTMFIRLWRRGVLTTAGGVEYTIVDVKYGVLQAAYETISTGNIIASGMSDAQGENGKTCPNVAGSEGAHHVGMLESKTAEIGWLELTERVKVSLVQADAHSFLKRRKKCFDVLIGAAVMDLWELETTLHTLFNALDVEAGLAAFYFPINFDGTTHFSPESVEGSEYDSRVEEEFHIAMGNRKVHGKKVLACHTGRYLIPCLRNIGARVEAMGGSSWLVTAEDVGKYVADEAYFLRCMIDFIESTCGQSNGVLYVEDSARFGRYIASRKQQISTGILAYVAHNIDVFGVL